MQYIPRIYDVKRQLLQIQILSGFGRNECRFKGPPHRLVDFFLRKYLVLAQKFEFLDQSGLKHRRIIGIDTELYSGIIQRTDYLFQMRRIFYKSDAHVGCGTKAEREILFPDCFQETGRCVRAEAVINAIKRQGFKHVLHFFRASIFSRVHCRF